MMRTIVSEVGEAFRPITTRLVVAGSYVIAFGYVFADTYDKYKKAQKVATTAIA